jgi:hypothetical protein
MADEVEDKLLLDLRRGQLRSPRHSLLIRPFLFGQFRIQLTRVGNEMVPGAPAGRGDIVRELCTYSRTRASIVATALRDAEDPEQRAEEFANPWNCEGPGARIRLDNCPEDRPETMGQQVLNAGTIEVPLPGDIT